MHFVKLGKFLAASRITGPKHNLLQIQLGDHSESRPVCERLPAIGECAHPPLNEPDIIRHVLEGIADANAELGTAYAVSHIRYVENDTQPESIYNVLARRIIEHLHKGGEFTPGSTVDPQDQ